MKVQDAMQRGVISIGSDEPLQKAARLMLQYDMSGFPVVDKGKLVGMITEGDFLRRAETGTQHHRSRWIEFLIGPGRLAEEYAHSHGRTVGEVMTRDVVTITEDAPLDDAVSLMERHHIKRLPVMRGDAMVGILTRQNLLHAFIVNLPKSDNAEPDDATIHKAVLAELAKTFWSPAGGVEITVKDGVVCLSGVIVDDRFRQALRIAAENTPGVKAVQDELTEFDRLTGVL